jgi:hypothetical protein
MNKIEPVEVKPSIADVISETPINGTIQIHADRIASFKSTLNRLNSNQGVDSKLLFSYTGVKNDYCTATRIA